MLLLIFPHLRKVIHNITEIVVLNIITLREGPSGPSD